MIVMIMLIVVMTMLANIDILQKLVPIMNNKQIAHQRFCSQNCELIPLVQKWVKGYLKTEGESGHLRVIESHLLIWNPIRFVSLEWRVLSANGDIMTTIMHKQQMF